MILFSGLGWGSKQIVFENSPNSIEKIVEAFHSDFRIVQFLNFDFKAYG